MQTRRFLAAILVASVLTCGCTSLQEYIHNGFKVGPNYSQPPAPVAKDWIDADDTRVRKDSDDLSKWWTVFNDPVLDDLICHAYRQNLTLREAGFRVLQARASWRSHAGSCFPQTQTATGDYTRNALSTRTANTVVPLPTWPGPAAAVLQQVGLRLQPELGTRLLGPVPAGGRSGRRQPGRLGRELRRRAGHTAGRGGARTTCSCALSSNGSSTPRRTWNSSARRW